MFDNSVEQRARVAITVDFPPSWQLQPIEVVVDEPVQRYLPGQGYGPEAILDTAVRTAKACLRQPVKASGAPRSPREAP